MLWDLLDTGHFRKATGKRIVDFDRDLGYAPGDEPYVIQYQLQAMQLLISPLGYTLTIQPSAHTGASQYVDLRIQMSSSAAAKPKSRHIAGASHTTQAKASVRSEIFRWTSLTLSAGGPSGTLGSGSYFAGYLGFSASANAGVTVERNRFLDGVKVNQQSHRGISDSRLGALARTGREHDHAASNPKPCGRFQ